MKLWKVRVNNWGWDSPRTKYARSRREAEEIADRYPAANAVQYAGNFTEANAHELLEED